MNRLDFSIIEILFYLADMVISYLQQENKANNYKVSDARACAVSGTYLEAYSFEGRSGAGLSVPKSFNGYRLAV